MDLGPKQAIVDPALPAQASAARVIRSCSRFCPPLSIVPNPAADPGADAIHATTTRNASSLQRCRRTSRPPYPHHPEPATPSLRPRRGIDRGATPPCHHQPAAPSPSEGGQLRKQEPPRFAHSGEIRCPLNPAHAGSPQRQGARYSVDDRNPRRCAKSARYGFSKNGTGPPPRHPDEPRNPAYRGATT